MDPPDDNTRDSKPSNQLSQKVIGIETAVNNRRKMEDHLPDEQLLNRTFPIRPIQNPRRRLLL
jgi:hypothetical protein